MKRFIVILSLLGALLHINSVQADYLDGLSIDTRFAAFFPLESKVRKIYDDVLPSIELEVKANVWNCWQGFFNVGYVWDSGRSIGLENKTDISLIPMSLGLNFVQPIGCNIDGYLGAGLAYSLVGIHDYSPFVHQHTSKDDFGAVVKAGFYYNYCDSVFFEGFFDYYYQWFHIKKDNPASPTYVERHDLNMSALKLGIGIGYNF